MAKWTLRRIYLNAGGYTPSGTYYGRGAPLYEAQDESEATGMGWRTFRANSRDAAKNYIRDNFDGNAVFYS